jgi:hypothetical protein
MDSVAVDAIVREAGLPQVAFEVAVAIAPRLRSIPVPRPVRFLGFVDVLSGQPSRDDPRPSGEVDFTLFDDEQGEIRARGILDADNYATAAAAYLVSEVVAFKGTLRRLPRISRVDNITNFEQVEFDDEAPEDGRASAS